MSTLACIGNSQLYACMLADNPNSPSSAACSASNAVGDQVVGTCDASTAMLTRAIKLQMGTVGVYNPGYVNGNGYLCCSPTQCTAPSAPMCDSTLWYCISTSLPSMGGGIVCVIDSGNPFSMSDCVTSIAIFSTYDKQCANISSPIFSSSTTDASTAVTSQMIPSTVTAVGAMTSVGTTTSAGTIYAPTNGPPPVQHHTPGWVTPLWTTILGAVVAAAIGYLFYQFIWSRCFKGVRHP